MASEAMRKSLRRQRQAKQHARFEPVEGYVWCDRHGEIHDDTLDPYDYDVENQCLPSDHTPVFVRAKGGE